MGEGYAFFHFHSQTPLTVVFHALQNQELVRQITVENQLILGVGQGVKPTGNVQVKM